MADTKIEMAGGEEGKKKKNKTGGGIKVEIGYHIFKVSQIDAVAQKFFCDFKLYFQWCDPSLIGRSEDEEIKWADEFHPNFYIKNALAIESEDEGIRFKDSTTGRVVHTLTYRGELSQFFKLKSFPFDVQNLRIEVSSKNHMGKNEFVDHTTRKSQIEDFNAQEWTVEKHRMKIVATDPETHPSGKAISEAQIKVRVRRMPAFYMWNVVSFAFLLTSLCFFTSAIDASDLGGRMGVTLTILLTNVAFKFAVGDSLPKISYFTLLDYYMSIATWFVFLMTTLNFIVARIYKDHPDDKIDVKSIDDIMIWLWLLFWVIFNIIFAIYVKFALAKIEAKEAKKHGKGDD